MIKLAVKLVCITLMLWTDSFGQGCSDAGFCTISSFKPNSSDSTRQLKNYIKIGAFIGKADNSISVFGNFIEYGRMINDQFGMDIKLTSLAQSGNSISVFGLSDIFLNATYMPSKRFKLIVGSKIPLSKADKTQNNRSLPMDYQSSLGSLDLIFGIGYEIHKLQFIAAAQQPITQNDNQFIHTEYPSGSEMSQFHSTRKFRRSGDILLRVSYPITVNPKIRFTPSILPIYHLGNDKFTDELNVEREILGSKGLTLNGNVYLDYEIRAKKNIQFSLGVPFVVRDTRPEGLTRSIIANLEYRIKF